MKKLGITDPMPYLKRQLPNSELCTFLDSCVISETVDIQSEHSIEEVLHRNGWVDVSVSNRRLKKQMT